MNAIRPADRGRASLLDRLLDHEPETQVEAPRAPTRAELRQAVLRDLDWLFNATRAGFERTGNAWPQVRHSVLNFGLPTFSGQTLSSVDPQTMAAQVREAILDFEPRITPATLQVVALAESQHLERHNLISFRISGELESLQMQLLLRTDIDLETGRVIVRELGR